LLTADTGERGLVMAQREKLDLIVLDVILPKMKGREVCQRLKENSRTKDIPIIFLTVQNSPDDIQAEMDAGAVSHLTKPVDFPTVYKEITKVLSE
jgi:putative two-component system response regulator